MRSRALPALVGVTALAFATALAGNASAAAGPTATAKGSGSDSITLGQACAGASNLGVTGGQGIAAQDFENAYNQYDSEGAADFKPTANCTVKSIYIEGFSNGAGNPTAFNWAIYTAKGKNPHMPDKKVKKCSGKVNLDGTAGSFKFNVKKGCKLKKKKKYSLVGSAQQDFGTSGQWYWLSTPDRVGELDAWRNPNGGFGNPDCEDWNTIETCIGAEFAGLEYIFAIQKTAA